MSKQSAEHHTKAAEHHEHAARHHTEAAKHYAGGSHEKAAHHAHVAHGHTLHAVHHQEEAAKTSPRRTRVQVIDGLDIHNRCPRMITGTPVCVRRPATAAEAVAESWRNGLAEAQKTLETPADKRRECSMLVSFRPITYLTAGELRYWNGPLLSQLRVSRRRLAS
jgi:hypothetical protein